MFHGVYFVVAGHKYGPQSSYTKQAVRDVDEILYDLQDLLVKNDLVDEVNVYILTDHGMMSSKNTKQIELDDYIDMNDVELVLGEGASVQILAEKGKHIKVCVKQRHFGLEKMICQFAFADLQCTPAS